MKLLTIFILTFATAVFADVPTRIEAKTKVLHSASWYVTQSLLWKNAVDESPANADAWLNYYTAARFGQQSENVLDMIAAQMRDQASGSYEYLLVDGWNKGFTPEGKQQLLKALQLRPEHAGTYGLLALHSEFGLNSAERKSYSKKLYESGQISTSLINYSYNVLMSVEENSVLFTEGENTTLPLFVLQDVLNVRKDVVVLNLDLLLGEDYLGRKFKTVGLIPIAIGTDGGLLEKNVICADVPQQNSNRKFYYALTLQQDNIQSIKDQLYVVGLASEISATRMDNIAVIRENLEKKFLMDYLMVDFNGESEFATGRVLSANYLVPLLLIYEQYKKENNSARVAELTKMLKKIARDSDRETMVNNFLARETKATIPYVANGVDFKTMGLFRPVTKKLHANESEVTNLQYNLFLAYLKKNNLNDLYDQYKFDLSSYAEPALSFMKTYTAYSPEFHMQRDKAYQNHPAVNVSYESALAFCDWLTDQYNRSSTKKFKEVKFRLPTLEEWIISAVGVENPTSYNLADNTVEVKFYPEATYDGFGKKVEKKNVKLSDEDIMYPWYPLYNFRNTPRNNKECFLGNFKLPEGTKTCPTLLNKIATPDGFLMMAPVKSYFPNMIGLYDVVGNVEEMIADKGKACGGSWDRLPEESTMKSVHSYNGSNSSLGFRVFMEVIQE